MTKNDEDDQAEGFHGGFFFYPSKFLPGMFHYDAPGLLMLRKCFLDFAVEHRFGCHATGPGFAGDIGAIEV